MNTYNKEIWFPYRGQGNSTGKRDLKAAEKVKEEEEKTSDRRNHMGKERSLGGEKAGCGHGTTKGQCG